MGIDKRTNDARRHEGDLRNEHPGAGEQAGEAVGGIGGTLAGAALGSTAGPLGMVLGGLAGAFGGWWAGEKAGRAAEDMEKHDAFYRAHHAKQRDPRLEYEDARVGYAVGHVAGHNPDYHGRTFDQIEGDLRRGWSHDEHDFETMRPYVRMGYARTVGERSKAGRSKKRAGGVSAASTLLKQHRRRRQRIRRLLDSREGRLALAGMLGVTGVGALKSVHHPPPAPPPHHDDPVKQAVAETMVERLAGRGWDLPNLDHSRVDFWVDRFTTDPDMNAKLAGFLSRSGQYVPMISIKLEERDMPHDLLFLALIESGFDPEAFSSASASGLWQFVAETGRRYGLVVNKELDERNHPEKSTDAALQYLTELHDRFGSWYLAAAAYNTGENRVGRIMREVTGSERASDEADYYKIWDRLPKETRDYVPLMIAAARIAKDPARYGFDHVVPLEPIAFDEIRVAGHTPLSEIAKVAGVETSEVRALNPFLRGKHTPKGEYLVRVPPGAGMRVSQSFGGANALVN
jgi:hypothetical protein